MEITLMVIKSRTFGFHPSGKLEVFICWVNAESGNDKPIETIETVLTVVAGALYTMPAVPHPFP